MSTDTVLIPDPKNHPDNAHLPTVNEPATLLGITIAFLVGTHPWDSSTQPYGLTC